MCRLPRLGLASVFTLLAGCAGSPPPAAPATAGQVIPIPGEARAATAGLSDTTISACRSEAERATVLQNRGEMMRLDEAENRGGIGLIQTRQERGLLVTTRDRLFRDCLARARVQADAAASRAGAPSQTSTPR